MVTHLQTTPSLFAAVFWLIAVSLSVIVALIKFGVFFFLPTMFALVVVNKIFAAATLCGHAEAGHVRALGPVHVPRKFGVLRPNLHDAWPRRVRETADGAVAAARSRRRLRHDFR